MEDGRGREGEGEGGVHDALRVLVILSGIWFPHSFSSFRLVSSLKKMRKREENGKRGENTEENPEKTRENERKRKPPPLL